MPASGNRQWKVGDLVLAKVKGFPAWPAAVSEPEKWGYSTDWKKVLVHFFGTQQIAFCNPADVEAFTEEKKQSLLTKCHAKGSDFVSAVNDIIESYEKLKQQEQAIDPTFAEEATLVSAANTTLLPQVSENPTGTSLDTPMKSDPSHGRDESTLLNEDAGQLISCCSSSPMASSSLVRIAVVGDIHGFWDLDEDRKALQLLQPDLVLFTGDFGEENVPLLQSVVDLPFPKAVILGNHDAWHTQKFTSKQNGVQMQLDILGDEHVGYQRLDFPSFKLSIVGGRPFSHGGDQLFRKKLLVKRYGVRDMDASAGSICRAAQGTPEDHVAIILAHNGPTGLGSQADDICGRDWADEGGDHGDPDLEQAIWQLKETTKLSLLLVVFGHMHKELESGKGNRKMVVQGSDNQTVYLNGAIVPRVKGVMENSLGGGAESESGGGGTTRAFTLVEILDGKIKKVGESWVQVIGSMAKIVEETILVEDVT